MGIIFHILTPYADPKTGGLEASLLRVSRILQQLNSENQVVVYSLFDTQPIEVDEIEYRYLCEDRESVRKPLENTGHGLFDSQRTRVDIVNFKRYVWESCQEYPDCEQVLVSFYLSSAGFIAQHVASELRLRHIACIRGSDFHQDVYNPYKISTIEFVIKHSDWVVCTNELQRNLIQVLFGRTDGASVIYNSVQLPDKISWEPSKRDVFRLVSDCGFAYKKATHLLIESVAELMSEGYPMSLSIVGKTDCEQTKFWEELKSNYSLTNPNAFVFNDWVEENTIINLLLTSDIYCSASLSEGCSNSRMRALALGIPIASTSTGALPYFSSIRDNILMSQPGSAAGLRNNIVLAYHLWRDNKVSIDQEQLNNVRKQLSISTEENKWNELIGNLGKLD